MVKRAGFARAIITNPEIVLYDEPTTGLDPIITHVLTDMIMRLRKRMNGTAVVVSHDLQSIFMMADYVAMLFEGAIIAYGTVAEMRSVDQPDRAAVLARKRGRTDSDMSRQAIVGAFTLLGLVSIFAVYFVLSNFSARVSGYQAGVHFASAAGLTKGAIVYESGVQVGTVSEIQMLDDFTVDVIVQVASWVDIPRDSDFIISAPLTGTSTLTIVPPRKKKEELALLPRYVLPVDQQPRGKDPVSIQALLESGRGELNKFDALLTDLTRREPHLMDQLQSAIGNANALAETANGAMQQLSHKGLALTDSLQRSLDTASASIIDLTGQLDQTVRRNGGRIDTLLGSLNRTADSLAVATDSLKSMATNPQLRAQLTDTVAAHPGRDRKHRSIDVRSARCCGKSADARPAP